jgi:hypothetical protein
VRSRLLRTTVLAAVAGAMWTQMPQLTLRRNIRWRLSLKCWFMGHEDWIRRTPDRVYLECFECGRETQGWATGKRQSARARGPRSDVPAIKPEDHSSSIGPFANETTTDTRPRRPRRRHDRGVVRHMRVAPGRLQNARKRARAAGQESEQRFRKPVP